MSDENDEVDVMNRIYHKKWDNNTPKTAEVILLLELVEVLERRGSHTEEGKKSTMTIKRHIIK